MRETATPDSAAVERDASRARCAASFRDPWRLVPRRGYGSECAATPRAGLRARLEAAESWRSESREVKWWGAKFGQRAVSSSTCVQRWHVQVLVFKKTTGCPPVAGCYDSLSFTDVIHGTSKTRGYPSKYAESARAEMPTSRSCCAEQELFCAARPCRFVLA